LYKESRTPKRSKLGIQYPGINSTPYIVLGGKTAKEIYDFILQLLDNNGIKHPIHRRKNYATIELPLATGLATTMFLLSAYSCVRPLRHAAFLERMILGKIPLTKYFVMLTELSTDLTNYLGAPNPSAKQTLNREAARTISKMLLQLMEALKK
jgi:hypothetical protein